MFNRMMNVGDPQTDVEQETIHYHGQSVALTKGQGIPCCDKVYAYLFHINCKRERN